MKYKCPHCGNGVFRLGRTDSTLICQGCGGSAEHQEALDTHQTYLENKVELLENKSNGLPVRSIW